MELPSERDRTVVIGRTGSGKTVFGLWLLSKMDLQSQPWIVIDYKGDENIAGIPYIQEIPVGYIPTEPGLYVVRPMYDDDESMNDYLYAIWDTGNVGLFVDEGAMLSKSAALNTILIQGRSKRIPVIVLTQRPVGISRYAFSESQYIVVFPNHDKREQKTVGEFTPIFQDRNNTDADIPPFHFYYYDVRGQKLTRAKPVPNMREIYRNFELQLEPEDTWEDVQMGDTPRMRRFKPI
jgi:hypothetical protein